VIGVVLSCEHASWTLPPGDDLGVSDDELRSQASWDHGAFEIAAGVGEALGLPVHTGAFSRMFVDLNRPPEHPDVIPLVSYGATVPGNARLGPEARARRIADYHAPYWAAVRRDVEARLLDRGRCLHLSSHSFCPSLDPSVRVFDVGVLYDPAAGFEAELAERMMFGLRAAGLVVRANEPYVGTAPALVTSLRQRYPKDRYAGIEVETSYAVTRSAGGCARIAAALVPVVEALRDGT
jgi:predicted N-formylglutamate amidohydrolase